MSEDNSPGTGESKADRTSGSADTMSDKERRERALREKLLIQAYKGELKISPQQVVNLFNNISENRKEIPPEHQMILNAIDQDEPRSVRALNLREELRGTGRKWVGKTPPPQGPTIH